MRRFAFLTGIVILSVTSLCATAALATHGAAHRVTPDLPFVLLIVGVLSIYAEFLLPGAIAPGVLGSMLALFSAAALAKFPFTWYGAALLAASLAGYAAEARFRTRGLWAVSGGLSMIAGSVLLIPGTAGNTSLHPVTAIAVTVPFATITTGLFSIAVRARRNKYASPADAAFR